jgi:hypothetical protein
MISGDGCRREKAASLRIELKAKQMFGPHLVVASVVTAATVAGCITYLLQPSTTTITVDQQLALRDFTFSARDTAASKAADRRPPVENERAAIAYLEAAQAILRRAPLAQASASTDELFIRGRIPLPRKRPIPR